MSQAAPTLCKNVPMSETTLWEIGGRRDNSDNLTPTENCPEGLYVPDLSFLRP